MPISDADLWHQVHAQREDGVAAMFLIREVEPRADQPRLLVIEMPYTITDASKLPDTTAYRRLDTLQEQWIEPACEALGWTFVAWKSEDGSFFLYLYGGGDPGALLERLGSFDGALGFFNDSDADWSEYAALRELVEQAQAAPEGEDEDDHDHVHTADCDHAQGVDDLSEEFPAIDLTGVTDQRDERPGKPRTAKAKAAKAKPAKAKPAKAKPAKAKPAKAKPAKAKPAKAEPAKAKPAKASTAKARPAKPKATKPKATKPKAAKSASAKPAKAKARPTASRATSRPAPRRAAAAQKSRK
jgi:hypothetical protein